LIAAACGLTPASGVIVSAGTHGQALLRPAAAVPRAIAVVCDAVASGPGGEDLSSVVADQAAEIAELRAEMQSLQGSLAAKQAAEADMKQEAAVAAAALTRKAMEEETRLTVLAAEKAAVEAIEEARRNTLLEAASVLAEAELADVLLGSWAKTSVAQPPPPVFMPKPSSPLDSSIAAGDAKISEMWPEWSANAASAGRPTGTVVPTGLDASSKPPDFDEWMRTNGMPPVTSRPDKRRRQQLRVRKEKTEQAIATAQAAVATAVAAEAASVRPDAVADTAASPMSGKKVVYKRFGVVPGDFNAKLVETLIDRRTTARLKRHYSEADRLQRRIQNLGAKLDDRRRTWSVVKGWKKMQRVESGNLEKADAVARAIRESHDPQLTSIGTELDKLLDARAPMMSELQDDALEVASKPRSRRRSKRTAQDSAVAEPASAAGAQLTVHTTG